MLLGQLVASLRMGIGILMAAMYLVEIAPEGKGDFFGVSFAVGFSSGHFLGAFLGIENIFGGVETWQYSICVGLGLGVIQLLLHPLIMRPRALFYRRDSNLRSKGVASKRLR